MESTIHNAIFNWLTESGHISLTSYQNQAEFILTGEILSVSHPGSSYGAFDRVRGLKAVIKVNYSLKEVSSGDTILNQSLFTREETYDVGKDAVSTLSARKEALFIMADEIAEEIYMSLLSLDTASKKKQTEPSLPKKKSRE